MLNSITLENFLSYRESQTIALNKDVNVLVGINGSGKTNLIKALRLVHEGITSSFKAILNKWGGFEAIANYSSIDTDTITILFEFNKELINNKGTNAYFKENPRYKISIHKLGNSDYYLSEELSILNEQYESPYLWLKMESGMGQIAENDDNDKIALSHYGAKEKFDGQELVLKQLNDPKRHAPLIAIRKVIEQFASNYGYFDTSTNSPIRLYGEYGAEAKLKDDGSNLTQMLQRLSTKYPLEYEKLITNAQKINPHYKDIRFDYLGNKFLAVLVEKNLAKTIPISALSDGTLRFLLLLTIIYNPERGKVVGIDEPETGMHPDMIMCIVDAIKEAAKNGTQFILASHSPIFLNLFTLDDILIIEKNDKNCSIVNAKTEADFEDWVGDFLPGKMWLQGLIGGRRW